MLSLCMVTISGDFNLYFETPELLLDTGSLVNSRMKHENDFVPFPLCKQLNSL